MIFALYPTFLSLYYLKIGPSTTEIRFQGFPKNADNVTHKNDS